MSDDFLKDVLERNAMFSRITPLSFMITQLDMYVQEQERGLLDELYCMTTNVLSSDFKNCVDRCRDLKNNLERIKKQYNIYPGETVNLDEINYSISDLENDLKSILNSLGLTL